MLGTSTTGPDPGDAHAQGHPADPPPALLSLVAEMGHGGVLVLADANFPAVAIVRRLARADGHGVPAILEAILQLVPLDGFVEQPAAVMQQVDRPDQPAPIWAEFQRLLDGAEGRHVGVERVERVAFDERAAGRSASSPPARRHSTAT